VSVLTPRRKAILTEIRKNGRSPSYRELVRTVGYASLGSVNQALNVLRSGGYLTWVDRLCRTLTLTGKGLLAAQGYELIYLCDQDGIHEVR